MHAQGWASRLLRGRTRFVEPEAYAGGAFELPGFRHGLIFGDLEGRLVLEWYTDDREKLFELAARSPLAELRRTLVIAARGSLFATVRGFARHPQRETFVAGVTVELTRGGRDLRVREAARDLGDPRSAPVVRRIMGDEIPALGRRLGAQRLVAETFPAYGKRLVAMGWRVDSQGRPWVIRAGAWLNRDACYVMELG